MLKKENTNKDLKGAVCKVLGKHVSYRNMPVTETGQELVTE